MSNIQHRSAEFAKLLNATVKYVQHDIDTIDSLKAIRKFLKCVPIQGYRKRWTGFETAMN